MPTYSVNATQSIALVIGNSFYQRLYPGALSVTTFTQADTLVLSTAHDVDASQSLALSQADTLLKTKLYVLDGPQTVTFTPTNALTKIKRLNATQALALTSGGEGVNNPQGAASQSLAFTQSNGLGLNINRSATHALAISHLGVIVNPLDPIILIYNGS